MVWISVFLFLGLLIPAAWYIITKVVESADLYNEGVIPSI